MLRFFGFPAALLLSASFLAGQTQNGNILGEVRDASGAVVPNVNVELTEQQTGAHRTVQSGPDGAYRFALVPLGVYTISAEHPGFKKFVDRDVSLATNQTLRHDIVLDVGQTTEAVTVQEQAAVITTDTAEITSTKGKDFIAYHPSLVFNPSHLLASASISSTEQQFSFYGSRQQATTTTVDGAQFDYWNNYVLGYSAQEVKSEALLAPAKYQTPVTVNLVTKQGGNMIHGMVEGTLYNSYFAAQPPRNHVEKCSTGRPCTGTWTSGVSASGPVYIPKLYDGRNKTFWMFTYTPQKNFRNQRPTTNIVPNAALRAGDFSALPTAASVKDPLTGQPFPGNRVPASRINPVTQKLLALYPQPDSPGGNVASVISRTPDNKWYTMSGRLDQRITDRNNLMFSFTRYNQIFAYDFADRSVVGYMGIARGIWNAGTYTFGDTHTFSPSVVNEVRFGANWEGPTGYFPDGVDTRQRIEALGLTSVPEPRATLPVTGPDISFSGSNFTPFLGWSNSATRKDRFYHVSDNLSVQHGRHTIQTGFEFKWANNNALSAPTSIWPAYSFTGKFSGDTYVDFLLGLPGTITRTNQRPEVQARRRFMGIYLQDDWRVTPKLTLNIGVRYDWIGPQYDAAGLYFNYDLKTGSLVVPDDNALRQIDPAWNLQRNPIITAQQAGFPSKLMNADANNVSPRIGFAYRPLNNQNFVLRGGYGIYMIPDTSTTTANLLQTGGPFALSVQFDNALTSAGQPLLQWPLGWPSVGGTFRGTPSVSGIVPNWVTPYSQQWNFTIEKSVWGQGLRLSYVGTKDTKLGYKRNINLPPPSTTPFSADRYINPAYVGITYVDNGASASYHGFETNLRTKGIFGIRGDFGYRWAKQMTDLAFNTFESVGGNSIENPYCRTCERARSEIVPEHYAFAGYTWDLPFGRNKTIGKSLPRWANAVIGNWMITSTIRARTGLFITPTFTGPDISNTNTFGGRPDLIGDPNLPKDQRQYDHWYNTVAFAIPGCPAARPLCSASERQNVGRFGNAGRNLVEGPGIFYMDMGFYKFFPIHESRRIVFSMTSDNILNKVNYGFGRSPGSIPGINAPNPGFLSALYENISTRQNNYMRQLFFNVRFEF